MALAGAFEKVAAGPVAGLRYIRAHGGEPPAEETDITKVDFAELAEEARVGLERLIALFDDPEIAYRALRRPGFDYRYDDYAHLARVDEWSLGEADEGGYDG